MILLRAKAQYIATENMRSSVYSLAFFVFVRFLLSQFTMQRAGEWTFSWECGCFSTFFTGPPAASRVGTRAGEINGTPARQLHWELVLIGALPLAVIYLPIFAVFNEAFFLI